MKRFALRAIFCALFIAPLAITARAQDTNTLNHGEIGVFADYFRLGAPRTNFWGLGGRLSFNVNPFTQLEAEMAYDFAQAFTEGFTSPTTGAIAVSSSDLRVLHGYFGPKFQTGGGPIRAFV